jgi:hypothetical protein
MRHFKADDVSQEIQQLKAKLKVARGEIRELKQYIQEQEDIFPLRMFEHIEAITHHQSLLLNPYPVKIKTSDKGNKGVFECSVRNVICIVSLGRLKRIYLRKKVVDIEGRTAPKNLIIINRNNLKVDQLLQQLDSSSFHLVQVSKGLIVNTAYYAPLSGKLELQLKDVKFPNIASFKISNDNLKVFIEKRTDLYKIASLHRMFVRYINEGKPL